jgi:hypothetical protein
MLCVFRSLSRSKIRIEKNQYFYTSGSNRLQCNFRKPNTHGTCQKVRISEVSGILWYIEFMIIYDNVDKTKPLNITKCQGRCGHYCNIISVCRNVVNCINLHIVRCWLIIYYIKCNEIPKDVWCIHCPINCHLIRL